MNKKSKMSWLGVLLLLLSAGLNTINTEAIAKITIDRSKHDDVTIDYKTRLKFYLDLKTKRFLQQMAIKEKLLLELIQNVTGEIRARGKTELSVEKIGFDSVYGRQDSILVQYEAEIRILEQIIGELEKLEQTTQRMDDLQLLEDVEQVKDHLMKILDEQKLATSSMTKQQAVKMITDYADEIKRILQMYDTIEVFQQKANYMGDIEIVKQLNQQKRRIIQILEESRIAKAAPDQIVKDYIQEAASIVDILKKIEVLSEQASGDSTLKLNIDNVRTHIMSNVDKRILELFGYIDNDEFKGRTISEYFQNWKAEHIAEYQVKFIQYKILRDNLIKTGSAEEHNRMLEREITNALLNYADQNYELAEAQFQQIYEAYKNYYPDLDGVIFYQSEANFANNYYDMAQEGYLKIIHDFPNSQYLGQCYLRLIIISYTYDWTNKFFGYFNKIKEILKIDVEDFNKVHYLAGSLYINQHQYQEAQKVLESIKTSSKYYPAAQYLLGIAYLNLNKFTQAKKIFEEIISQQNYPWTDLNYSIIRNESLLKLGYLYYQRGEYEKALYYFDQISKGYEGYDASLLGQAWANLKKGQYENVINNVDLICDNYLLSNYTYEALVLSAHCKRIVNRTEEAREDLQYVANARFVLNKVQEYNEERKQILKQLNELGSLEETILERQDKKLYPEVIKIRNLIGDALSSFRYRGTVSSRLLEKYNDERKVLIHQIEEFDRIIEYASEQGEKQLLSDARKQRNRLITVLEEYQMEEPVSGMGYFLDYPLATKEGGIVYQRGIINKLISDLLVEKQRVENDMEMIAKLSTLSDESMRIDAAIDLEIIEEDLNDLNNQLNKFQVWLANHQIKDIKTETEQWVNYSGFGISDIDFVSYQQRIERIGGYSRNLTLIDEVLSVKKTKLEQRIQRFDDEVRSIQKELEAEKIRLEKLEKEKYFQDIYFETKTKEIENEELENPDL